MQTLIQLINGEQYITRKQIPDYVTGISFYDTQRMVKKFGNEVRREQIGKTFYYSLSDLTKLTKKQ